MRSGSFASSILVALVLAAGTAAVAALPRDVTVLLIEHDMDLVFSFADRISVLVNGAMLVEGPPEQVARDPQVKAVYLGEAADV